MATTDTTQAGPKINILLVDDERALRMVGERFLKKLGHEAMVAQTGAEALALFKNDPSSFQLIITDQNMPGMLGLELVMEVRKIDSRVPIILATGFADCGDLAEAKRLGVCEVIHKPYGSDVLATAIRRALGQK